MLSETVNSSLFLSETNSLLHSPGQLFSQRFVGLVRWQIQAVEARVTLRQGGLVLGLLDGESTRSVTALEILETVDGNARSAGSEL